MYSYLFSEINSHRSLMPHYKSVLYSDLFIKATSGAVMCPGCRGGSKLLINRKEYFHLECLDCQLGFKVFKSEPDIFIKDTRSDDDYSSSH